MLDDRRSDGKTKHRQGGTGFGLDTEAAGEGLLAGFEPFIKHTGMEQRSRES